MASVVHTVNTQRVGVYDVATMSWVAMEQPFLEAGTVNIPGTVTVSGTVTAAGPLTDSQLRATPITMSSNQIKGLLDYDGTTGDLLYFGEANSGSATSSAVWRVRKFLYTDRWAECDNRDDTYAVVPT